MFIDRINLNHLRIFEVVYKSRSMTLAAQELHLTQSGVSQHVKTLEEVLAVRLFDRVKQRLIPTGQAETLYEQCVRGLTEIERGLLEISGEETAMRGSVHIGIPLEFGHDVVVPLLGKLQKQYPGIKVHLDVGLAPRMNDLILQGELDFAFVDEFITDKRVVLEHVYNEDLELCASTEYLKKKGNGPQNRKYFESLEYVEYELGEPLLRTWFQQHYEQRGLKLSVRAYVEDAYCLSQLVLSGVGAGVLPGALLQKLIRQGHKLSVFKGRGKPVRSGISIASVKERTHSPAVALVLEFLKGNIAKLR